MAIVKKSISITEPQNQWVKRQLEDGRYGNESELYRELIRKAQKEEQALAELRAALMEGERDIAKGQFRKLSSKKDIKLLFSEVKTS